MARIPLASTDDLDEAGVVYPDEDAATSLLARASAIIRAYAGVTWLNADETATVDVPADIPGVVVGMVERATANPAGYTQETAGPFSRSWGSDAAQRLYLTRGDKSVIRAALGRNTIGTLSTTRGPIETGDVSCRDGIDYLSEIEDVTALMQ